LTFSWVIEANFKFVLAHFQFLLIGFKLMGIENIWSSFFRNFVRLTSIYLALLGLILWIGITAGKFGELSDLFLVCDMAMSEHFAILSYLILNRVRIHQCLFILDTLQVV